MTGFQNEGGNEITGSHLSDGDPGVGGLLGAKEPVPFTVRWWLLFYTGQHGNNYTYEILPSAAAGTGESDFNNLGGGDRD
jgi:hypothetical protein